MKILPDVALTYDDVLLVPQYSDVPSRRKLSTQTKLTRKIVLQAPIVSANMDTVTESVMAITMAREGGIGIIHRFMTIDEQVRQIERVKKAKSFIVEHPIALTVSHTVGDVKKIVEETYTGGILVLDANERLVGIITTRDLLFERDAHKRLSEIMTRDVVTAPPDTTLEQAEKILARASHRKIAAGGFEWKAGGSHHNERHHENFRISQGHQRYTRTAGGRRGGGSQVHGDQTRRAIAGSGRGLHRRGYCARRFET